MGKSKFLRNLFIMGAAAGLSIAASVCSASAETTNTAIHRNDITINFTKKTLTVHEAIGKNLNYFTPKKDLEILFGVATVKKAKDGTQQISCSSWDVYDVSFEEEDPDAVYSGGPLPVTIDLSTLKDTVDNYIQVKGDKNAEPVTIKIPKVSSKISAKFDAESNSVTMTDITNAKNPQEIVGDIEYRTTAGIWMPYVTEEVEDDYGKVIARCTDFSIYQKRGATLYFRKAAYGDLKNDGEKNVFDYRNSGVTEKLTDASNPNNSVTAYVVDSFPGKEVKVPIGKQANAPKLTIDYVKRLVTIPKNTEYRIIPNSRTEELTEDDWYAVEEKMVMNADEEDEGLNALVEGGIIEIRTPAKEASGKTAAKPASKIARVVYDTIEKIGDANSGATIILSTGSGATEVQSVNANDISQNSLTDAVGGRVTVAYTEKTSKGKKSLTGIKVTNNTNDVYEFIVADSNVYYDTDNGLPPVTNVDSNNKAIKTTKVKAGKQVSITAKNGQVVYVRRTGEKTGLWSTNYAKFGTIAWSEN